MVCIFLIVNNPINNKLILRSIVCVAKAGFSLFLCAIVPCVLLLKCHFM